jgi:hypothetical protein
MGMDYVGLELGEDFPNVRYQPEFPEFLRHE